MEKLDKYSGRINFGYFMFIASGILIFLLWGKADWIFVGIDIFLGLIGIVIILYFSYKHDKEVENESRV